MIGCGSHFSVPDWLKNALQDVRKISEKLHIMMAIKGLYAYKSLERNISHNLFSRSNSPSLESIYRRDWNLLLCNERTLMFDSLSTVLCQKVEA